jgi:DNA-binding beta-propeller fold protein YncE
VRTIGDPAENNGVPVLSQPWGVDVGPDGAVYVADTWNHRIVVFSPEGEFIHSWGHYGVVPDDMTTDAFWGPRDVALGPDGYVYVADTGGKRVRVYTTEGEWVRDLGGAGTALADG